MTMGHQGMSIPMQTNRKASISMIVQATNSMRTNISIDAALLLIKEEFTQIDVLSIGPDRKQA